MNIEKEIENLKYKYKNDDDAMKVIETLKVDIAYLEKKQKEPDYKGQTPEQLIEETKAILHDWY